MLVSRGILTPIDSDVLCHWYHCDVFVLCSLQKKNHQFEVHRVTLEMLSVNVVNARFACWAQMTEMYSRNLSYNRGSSL